MKILSDLKSLGAEGECEYLEYGQGWFNHVDFSVTSESNMKAMLKKAKSHPQIFKESYIPLGQGLRIFQN